MNITHLQTLINLYLAARTTPEQEVELYEVVKNVAPTSLPPDLQADVRLVKMLLSGRNALPEPPANYKSALCAQLNLLTSALPEAKTKRRRYRWAAAITGAAAAALLAITIAHRATSDMALPEPAINIALAQNSQSVRNGAAERAPQTSASTTSTPPAIAAHENRPTEKRKASQSKSSTATPQVSGPIIITEYYTPPEPVMYADTPIMIRTENGEILTAESIESSPEAIAMLEQAFSLISYSNMEISQSLHTSQEIVNETKEKIELDLNGK